MHVFEKRYFFDIHKEYHPITGALMINIVELSTEEKERQAAAKATLNESFTSNHCGGVYRSIVHHFVVVNFLTVPVIVNPSI
jgi:hypothetical protein